jgi:hypothetical protein
MDDLIIIGLVSVGVLVFLILLVFTAGMRMALGQALQKPAMRRVDRTQCPEYLKKFLEIEEKKLIDMGFNFLFCVFSEFLVTRDNTHQYTFIYYHPGNKTYARLTASEIPSNIRPWQVSFSTEFTNGKRLITLTCLFCRTFNGFTGGFSPGGEFFILEYPENPPGAFPLGNCLPGLDAAVLYQLFQSNSYCST